ncbi:OLC1v1012681C1 [Oldenlandia corymbosa var. corymbosa]|uniref:OLC1v1012681C1 n=1 Tax=Oldenlandia corymbosa var. corymbosa TaxID=529605 RepID=A0AAV1DYK0_OLDCO|nr:OLC1v1012681C1 [Oldenlandia corymbosa var. corymbosa]
MREKNWEIKDIYRTRAGKKVLPEDAFHNELKTYKLGYCHEIASEVTNKPQPKATRGPTLMGDIWAKVPNAKPIVIEFNINFQPISTKWQERFEVPEGMHPWILKSTNKKWKNWKSRIKRCYFNPALPVDVLVKRKPDRVVKDQWKSLLLHWNMEEVKEWSERNKEHRQKLVMPSTTGKLSFAEITAELTERLGRAPTRVELFAACYCDSECDPSNPEVGAKVSKLPPGSEDPLGPNDTFAKVMGKDPPGRVRMTGLGVCPSDLWGSNPNRNACYQMVLEHQELVQQQQATIARIEEKMDNTSRLLTRVEEKLQHQQVSSLGNQSNSTKLGQNLKVGREVLLKNMEGKVVALGWLNSLDPNQVVGGARLRTSCG